MLVECSSGTYIRSLAADLGVALGGCAHLASLRRLRVGSFGLDEAHALDDVLDDPEPKVLSPAQAMRDLDPVVARRGAGACGGARHVVPLHRVRRAAPGHRAAELGEGPFAMIDADGALLAVYERRGGAVKPAVVLA